MAALPASMATPGRLSLRWSGLMTKPLRRNQCRDSFRAAGSARRRRFLLERRLGRRRDAVYPEHDRLGVTGRIAEPVRATACEAEAVAVLERPAFGTDGELHFSLDHEACLFAVMRIEFVAGASAGLHMNQKQIEAAFRSGRTEQLLGDAGAPQ